MPNYNIMFTVYTVTVTDYLVDITTYAMYLVFSNQHSDVCGHAIKLPHINVYSGTQAA